MKVFWLLFTIFYLNISLLPCTDVEECKEINKLENVAHDKNENHKHDTRQCSPFCTCSCCSISLNFQSFNIDFVLNDISVFEFINKFDTYSINYNKNIAVNIWQPPKFC